MHCRIFATIVTREWQIADAFDDLVISAEVRLMKPDPQIYQLALERLGAEPEQAVFIDDSITNVLGAHGVGIHAIHFHNPGQAIGELNALLNGNQ